MPERVGPGNKIPMECSSGTGTRIRASEVPKETNDTDWLRILGLVFLIVAHRTTQIYIQLLLEFGNRSI